METKYSLYYNGEFVQAKRRQEVINPANGEVIAEVAVAEKTDVEAALLAARTAFDKGPWREISLAQRKEFLLRISQGILDKAQELAHIETLNTGKPIKETTFMDIPSAAKTFVYFADNLERLLKDEIISISEDIESTLVRQPHGVAALIVPWNYPLLIASWKMAAALAAGNTVVVKPSSLTPLSVLELAKIIAEAGLPKGVVNVINGSGAQLGEMLCTDRRVDMISFTGSNDVGKQILGYTARHVKKLLMELGGKSAAIVLDDADLELAVNGSLCSVFLNQGQMCTAMSRILVQKGVFDAFVSDFVAKAKRIKLGNGLDYETQMGPLISENQRKRVLSFVEKARKEGAKVLCGGKIPGAPQLKKGFFFEPTVLAEVPSRADIFNEEVFGPVVCIDEFTSPEEAVALANATEFGLAQCIWSQDAEAAQGLAAKIHAGTVWINTYGMFYDELPYGGFKQSGFGKELGREGFLEYTRLQNVLADHTAETKPLVNYWYGF